MSSLACCPEDFDFGSTFTPGTRVDMLVPARLEDMRNWGNTLAIIGRLKPGVTVEQARAEFATLVPPIEKALDYQFGTDDEQPEDTCERPDAPGADRAVGGGGPGAADRLRQPVEPAAGAHGVSREGVCGAASRWAPAAAASSLS